MEIKKIKTSSLKHHPQNPNDHSDNQITELVNSLGEFEQVKNIVVWQGQVIAGNGLLMAAKKSGLEEIEVQDVSDWSEKKAISFMVADNQLARMGQINNEVMADLIKGFDDPISIPGVDEDFLAEFDLIETGEDSEAGTKNTEDQIETLIPDEEIKKRINLADKIIYQFSGGRDSTLAILKTIDLVRDKNPVACYVDTGTEFPDILYLVHSFCEKLGLPLEVLRPEKNFFEFFGEKKCFPDPVFRDCVEKLVNKPLDEMYFGFDNALIIRGGRSKQKTSRSKSNVYQEVVKSKTKIRKLLNPLYSLSNEEYDADIAKVKVWPGYEKGFLRTACWCCPFQREPQWTALKEYYPMLWDVMKSLTKTWEFKKIKGDGCIKQFEKYWNDK